MDRVLPKSTMYKRQFKYGGLATTGFLILLFLLYGFRMVLKKNIYREDLIIAVAELGTIEETITASGIVVPEWEQTITSPIESRIDSVYYSPGDNLLKGESILLLQKDAIINLARLVLGIEATESEDDVPREIIEKLERQVAKIDSLLKEQGQLAAVNEQKKEGVVIGLKTLSLKSRLGGNHG